MRITLLFFCLAVASPAAAQTRIDRIAADFTKIKDQTKTKYGVSVRKFREVLSEPWRAGNVQAFAGRYESLGDPMHLEIMVSADARVTGRGSDVAPFELRNSKIVDAVLTGTKVYSDGTSEPFEGGFLKRSDRMAPDANVTVMHGLAILVAAPPGSGITGTLRVFLVRR